MSPVAKRATLNVNGKAYDLPLLTDSEGEQALDISRLRDETGLITLDSGYHNTGLCQSVITFVDGTKGILRYRGYPIEELAANASFLEVAYLLIYGDLPAKAQLEIFTGEITHHTLLPEDLKRIYEAFPRDAHPMALLSAAVSALSAFYQDSLDPLNVKHMELAIRRLIAKLPTIVAYAYKRSIGQPFVHPDNALDYTSRFLKMMFSVPAEPYEVDPQLAHTLDQLFLLHADHEQNLSTSTVRAVGSGRANIFASVAAGVNALWGPLHGGANQAVLEMLQQIADYGSKVQRYIDLAKDRSSGFRLMGFGHPVYENYDPRARIIKKQCDVVLDKLGRHDPLLDIARELEEAALHDDYFIERKLYPNVDFYSGIIYRAMGFPTNMFTVLFAIGRLPGWIAHWKEMIEAKTRIARPRQLYIGPTERHYLPLAARSKSKSKS
jgi:citrate synthase